VNVLLVDSAMVYAAAKSQIGDLSRSDGYKTGAVFGFVRMIESQVKRHDIDRVYLCFEAGGTAKKREFHPTYKSGRERSMAAPEENHQEDIYEWAMLRGMFCALAIDHEADDVIAYFAGKHSEAGDNVIILSRDHDFRALLNENTVMAWGKDVKTKDDFVNEYGFDPIHYTIFLALAGDPTDTVPRLMMPAKAKKMVQAFDATGTMSPDVPSEDFVRNMNLVEMGVDDKKAITLKVGKFDPAMLGRCYERLEFNSLVKHIPKLKEFE
jgi:DNA polymerase-1